MKDEKKSSIIKEALIDYNTIAEAAADNAKKRLATEFPNSFTKLLKEELNNKKAKESYKKIDDAQESDKDKTKLNKESDMKNQVKETVTVTNTVGKGEPFDQKAKKVQEDVKVTNTVGKADPFTEKKKGAVKIEEEREKEFMADVESDTPNQGKGELAKGVAFKEKIKAPTSGTPMTNLKETFDLSGLDMGSVEEGLDNAGEDDMISIDEIEQEIANMEGSMQEEIGGMTGLPQDKAAGSPAGQGGDAFNQKLIAMRNELDEMIKGVTGGSSEEEAYPEVEAQPESSLYEDENITDDDINNVLGGGSEAPVDEQLGVSHATNRNMTASLPGNDYVSPQQLSRRREGLQEGIKIGSLIEENKKLTKKLNEDKKYKQSVSTLVEQYKSALEKYRNQLKEMAVFNTNLAHVNNLLVNESLALTQDDKIKIINGFKTVGSISESQEKYTSLLTEMKGAKKTISESIVDKVTTSVQPSSKQKLDEVVEKTAYANNSHIQRMKDVINLIEKRGKK